MKIKIEHGNFSKNIKGLSTEIEGSDEEVIQKLLQIVEHENYKKGGNYQTFHFDESIKRQEAEEFFEEFTKKLIKRNKFKDYKAVGLYQGKGFTPVLSIRKENPNMYIATNYYDRISGKAKYCDVKCLDLQCNSRPVPDFYNPKIPFVYNTAYGD